MDILLMAIRKIKLVFLIKLILYEKNEIMIRVTIISKYIETSPVKSHKSTNFDNESNKDATDKEKKICCICCCTKIILDIAEKY